MRHLWVLSHLLLCHYALCSQIPAEKNRFIDLTIIGKMGPETVEGQKVIDLVSSLHGQIEISYLPTDRVSYEAKLPKPLLQTIIRSGIDFPGKVLFFENTLPASEKISRKQFWAKYGLSAKDEDQIRYAYIGLESLSLPEKWVEMYNSFFDAILVSDETLRKICIRSGITVPIFLLPLGRNYGGQSKLVPRRVKRKQFVFGSIGPSVFGKNDSILVTAFAQAFKNSPDVELQLIWSEGDSSEEEKVQSIIHDERLRNVIIKRHSIKNGHVQKNLLNVDCYVDISTGIPCSFMVKEAICLGIPTILSDCLVHKTICNTNFVRKVPATVPCKKLYPFPRSCGIQYRCTQEDVQKALEDLYYHYARYTTVSCRARDWAKKYSVSRMAKNALSLVSPKRVQFGEKNRITKQGIQTSDKKLFRKYKRLFK